MDLQPYIAWLGARLLRAAIAPDVTSYASAVAALFLAFFFIAWRTAARRACALTLVTAGLEADLLALRTALEKEIMWRMAGEAALAQTAKPASSLKPKPPRELQELIAKEHFDSNPTAATFADTKEDLLTQAIEGDQVI